MAPVNAADGAENWLSARGALADARDGEPAEVTIRRIRDGGYEYSGNFKGDAMTETVSILNSQLVGISGDGGRIVIMRPAVEMTKAEALRHAAWIVALADPLGEQFPAVLEAVRNT